MSNYTVMGLFEYNKGWVDGSFDGVVFSAIFILNFMFRVLSSLCGYILSNDALFMQE